MVKKLHGYFPKNILWQFIPGRLLLYRRTNANYALLKSWGVAGNQKGETRSVTTFGDKLFSVNQRLAEAKINRKQTKAELKLLREHRGLEYGLNANSMGQLWGIAQRAG